MILLNNAFLLLAIGNLYFVLGESIEDVFNDNQVVPDVVPVAPSREIKVSYPSGVEVDEGNELTPTQVKDQPSVTFEADPQKYYTLALIDPDVMSRANPTQGEFLHWLVCNICGDDVENGETIAEYISSATPKDTGLHRYVFLAYEQPGHLYFDEPRLSNTSLANRTLFSINDFSIKYKFGAPVGGNLYMAQYDPYVDILTARLNGGS